MKTINTLPEEMLLHIGSFLENPVSISEVSEIGKRVIAQGSYEHLYQQYQASSVIRAYIPIDLKKEDCASTEAYKVKVVQETYKNVIKNLKNLGVELSPLTSEGLLSPSSLETLIHDKLIPLKEMGLRSPQPTERALSHNHTNVVTIDMRNAPPLPFTSDLTDLLSVE